MNIQASLSVQGIDNQNGNEDGYYNRPAKMAENLDCVNCLPEKLERVFDSDPETSKGWALMGEVFI